MTKNSSADHHLLALFGGTFDPIHYGHLLPVEALAKEIGLSQIALLPNNVPPHRPQPQANTQQRLDMLQLAIAGSDLFSIDTRELKRSIPSYSIDTLEEIRDEQGKHRPLAFIIGQDSLLSLHKWHRWQSLLDYCHLLVCARPGYANHLDTPELELWLNTHLTDDSTQLCQRPHGLIYLAHTPLLNISATDIRRRQQQNQPYDDLVPPTVQHYIQQQGLYR